MKKKKQLAWQKDIADQLQVIIDELETKPNTVVEEIWEQYGYYICTTSTKHFPRYDVVWAALAEAVEYIDLMDNTDLVPVPFIKERILSILKGEKTRDIPGGKT